MNKSLALKTAIFAFVFLVANGVSYSEAQTAPNLTCSPSQAQVKIGEKITFKANGGTGSYTWTAPDMTPRTGSEIEVFYPRAGVSTMTVQSGTQIASCAVTITGQVLGDTSLSCGPAVRNVLPGQIVELNATGGSGNYVWTAPNMTAQTGSLLRLSFPAAGSSTITLHSGANSVSCVVNILGSSNVPTTPGLPNTGAGGSMVDLLNLGVLLSLSGMTTLVAKKHSAAK